MMNLDLTGKTAVVCGATQGIGFATATQLAKQATGCIKLALPVVLLPTLLLSRHARWA